MGADQIAAIRPIIVELEVASRDGSEREFCGTFEVPSGEGLWVELVLGTINTAYPWLDDPTTRVREMVLDSLPGLSLQEWEPGKFATFSYERSATRREIARFVDGLFSKLLGCGNDYMLDVGITSLVEGISQDPGR